MSRSRDARNERPAKKIHFLVLWFMVIWFLGWGIRKAVSNKPDESVNDADSVPAVLSEEDKKNIDKALGHLELLKNAMRRYRYDVGELPPRGDYCPSCTGLKEGRIVRDWKKLDGSDPRLHMTELELALTQSDGPDWSEHYWTGRIPTDPWGREYTYDDNDPRGANPGDTYLWSAGPDRSYGTNDDPRVLVLSLEEGQRPMEEWKTMFRKK